MAYETIALENTIPSAKINEAELPVREFIGYDPKGTTTITGSDRIPPENTKQVETGKGDDAAPEAPSEESVTLSPKVSALARKEQAQRKREADLERRETEIAEKLKKAEKLESIQAKLAKKDYSALEELGVDYNEHTKHVVDREAARDPKEERVQKVEKELADLKKAKEESEVREYNANQALWLNSIKDTVRENPDFSTIKELGLEEIVRQHINDSFEEDGVELTVEDACKDIEAAAFERAEKFAGVSKLKTQSGTAKVLGPPKTSPKTITQNMTVTSKPIVRKPLHLMSESEQIAEAFRRVEEEKLARRK